MRISFLTSSHFPQDDRIYHHFAKSAARNGHDVEIISSVKEMYLTNDMITINSFDGNSLPKKTKIKAFIQRLNEFTPETIICSEPLSILSAYRYKKKFNHKTKIIYDITEWYPSKKNLIKKNIISKLITIVKLSLFNLYTTHLTDALIYGEWYKSVPFRILFPYKDSTTITYYPSKRYFQKTEAKTISNEINLGYSGKISKEKGFENFIKVINDLLLERTDLKINLKIIGWPEDINYKKKYKFLIDSLNQKRVKIIKYDKLSLEEYINEIKETDIFIDLRSNDIENQRCLPIRLFYFAAIGRPIIFSDLKSIRKEVDIENFGHLVNPKNSQKVIAIISKYIEDENLYFKHCKNAYEKFQKTYNWERIEKKFLEFISRK